MKIYSAKMLRKWDQFTIKSEPISSLNLMERAATACTKQIIARNIFKSVEIFCGTGNNGGDGLVIARILHERGIPVTVFIVEISENPSDDFKKNLKRLPKKIKPTTLNQKKHSFQTQGDLLIDAIFGSGLNKEPNGWIAKVIDQINTSQKRVVSVDVPSGLFCDDNRGNSLRHAIRAAQTITFQTPKMSFLFADYGQFTGDFHLADIGLSERFDGSRLASFFTRKDIILQTRKLFSHKGSHGYLLVVGGFQQYGGAIILASRAAYRAGCGYVATHADLSTKSSLLSTLPECLFIERAELPEKTTAVAIGPGLGLNKESLAALKKILVFKKPIVFDADAINLLAANKQLLKSLPADSILTPHLVELERLIGKFKSPEETLEKQISFSKKHSVYIIQKGAFSKITCPNGDVVVNSSGNPGMASAGMGDVLTGIIGSFLAQGYHPKEAACYGTFIHGYAADLVKRKQGERGMLASDVIEQLPFALSAF